MNEWVGLGLDGVLIVLVSVGIYQATRLMYQLRDLRAGRIEMERFVRDFNAAVMRAEAGVKSLRSAARETGDDLEKLVEKGTMIRDELSYIVESADSVAERLSVAASGALHGDKASKDRPKAEEGKKPVAAAQAVPPPAKTDAPPASRAEKELLQALQKMK